MGGGKRARYFLWPMLQLRCQSLKWPPSDKPPRLAIEAASAWLKSQTSIAADNAFFASEAAVAAGKVAIAAAKDAGVANPAWAPMLLGCFLSVGPVACPGARRCEPVAPVWPGPGGVKARWSDAPSAFAACHFSTLSERQRGAAGQALPPAFLLRFTDETQPPVEHKVCVLNSLSNVKTCVIHPQKKLNS
jgi:hypothetical protein